MFSLLVGFWQAMFRKVEFQVLILGLDRAGKTSALEQIKAMFLGLDPLPASKIPPTVGLNIGRMTVNRAKLILWDLGGQSALRAIWEKYFAEAHGLIFVVDAADPDRFEESRAVLHQLLNHPDLAGIPLLVFANKQDAEGAVPPHEIEAIFGLHQTLSGSQPRKVVGVAALNGDGIQESVEWMVDSLHSSPRAQALQQ
tara:strand:- start:3515 stop:4108 length:594 start_codon:yes stop_codon:yes gene_type:complete